MAFYKTCRFLFVIIINLYANMYIYIYIYIYMWDQGGLTRTSDGVIVV